MSCQKKSRASPPTVLRLNYASCVGYNFKSECGPRETPARNPKVIV
jgi:hypothetical protein